MANQEIVEGEVLLSGEDDADLNQAFWDFRETLEKEANAGGSIAVYEVPVSPDGIARPKTLQKTRLFSTPVGNMSFDDILDRVRSGYMEPGGVMTIQILAHQDGKRGIRMNKLVRLRRERESAQPGDTSVTGILKLINEQNERNRAEFRAFMQEVVAARTPAGDPMTLGLDLAGKLTAMAAQLARPTAAPGVMGGAPANDPMSQMMNMMMTMMMKKFFADMDKPPPEAASGSDLKEIVGELGKIAVPFLQGHAASKAAEAANAQRALIHERAAVQGASTESADEQTTEAAPVSGENVIDLREKMKMRLMAELKQGLPMLCDMAEKQAEIADVVSLVASTLPDDPHVNDALYTLLSDKGCVDQLALIEPRVKEYREWFGKFCAKLLEEFTPDSPEPQA